MLKWAIEGIFKANVCEVDREIKSMGDKVQPSDLVMYAKMNPDSELYKCFEWDDKKAADAYRLGQARQVIQLIVNVPEKDDEPKIREYSITTERNTYKPTREFLVNQDEYQALLERALSELKALERKYSTLSELENVFAAIDTL